MDADCVGVAPGIRVCPGDDLRVDCSVDEGLVVRTILQSNAPPSSRSSSLGKARGFSLPSRMDTCPEWDEMDFPVQVLHFSGVGNE